MRDTLNFAHFILFFLFVLMLPLTANASLQRCMNNQVTLIGGNVSTDSAHLVDMFNCSTACGAGGLRAYVEFADKAIFSQLLTADLNNVAVNIDFETAAPSKGIVSTESFVTCKVVAVWLNG